MQTIRLRSHADAEGNLQLQLNNLPAHQEIEIVLVYDTVKEESEPINNENSEPDPIIGFFSGDPHLAEKSEDILQENSNHQSGLTWKTS